MTLALRIVAHSEIGLVRKNNQDSGYASPTLVVVADGMGGAAAGDLASSVAIAELVKADGHYTGEEMLEALAGAVVRANDRMADLIADNHSLDGMGTTVCGALFDGQRLGVVHIGDSRGYLRRDGELERLTHDHSWVQTLVDEGRITEAESLYHPHRSLILKVLNGQPIHEPDLFLVEVQAGDRIMFCSDGLCGLVPDATIDHLLDEPDLNHVLSDLTEAAHAGGGLDNITIIVADVYDADDATATAADTPAPSGATITVPTVVGAAATREIPAVAARPAIQLDAGDEPEAPTDRAGNPVPRAPAPAATPAGLAAADPEAARYAPQPRRRRGRTGLLVGILVLVLAMVGGGWGTYAYAQTRFYVGAAAATAGGSEVAIYRGVPGSLLGLPLSQVLERSGVSVNDLPVLWATRVTNTIPIPDGLDAARETVVQLRAKSEKCIQQRKDRAAATQTPSPSPSPSASSAAATTATPGSATGLPSAVQTGLPSTQPATQTPPGASATPLTTSTASPSQVSVPSVSTPPAPEEC